MQVELDENGEKFKKSLDIMKQFVNQTDKNIAFVPDPTGAAQILAGAKVIAASKQASDLKKTVKNIKDLSDEYSSTKKELKDLFDEDYDFFTLKGDNSSYADAMKKTFEEGLVKVNGNWISMKKWWTDGWDDYFDSVKDGASKILDELNPFKDLSTAEWTLTVKAYKNIIAEKYKKSNDKLKEIKKTYFGGFSLEEDFNISEAFGKKYASNFFYGSDAAKYKSSRQNGLDKLFSHIKTKKPTLTQKKAPLKTQINKTIKNTNAEIKNKIIHEFEAYSYNRKTRTQTGTEFEKVLASGADFIPNHYDAAFYWNTSTNTLDEFVRIKNVETSRDIAFLSPSGFAVRMAGITIPQLKNKTFDVNGVSHGIKKLSSSHEITKKTSFNFRLDVDVAWLKLFGQLIGENNFYEGTIADKEKFVTVFANSFSSGNINNRHLCLAIKLGNLREFEKTYYRVIVFEDVKITGTDNLKFSSEGGIAEMGIEFIYRSSKIYRVGKEDNKLGTLKDGGYLDTHKALYKIWT